MPRKRGVTLPSIEGAFGSMNILRDPPASRYTRYIDKVSDDNRILEQIDGASDRICELILPYARGTNPMVNVDFSNAGMNGGQIRYRSGNASGQTQAYVGPQASLPYKIMREGAFRPPIRPLEELLPLSRQPRLATSFKSNKASQQFLKDVTCKPDLRAVRKELLNICTTAKSSFIMDTPVQKPYNVESAIATRVQGQIFTNVLAPGTDNGQFRFIDTPSAGIQSPVHTSMQTNPGQERHTPLDSRALGLQPIPTKDIRQISQTSNRSRPGQTLQHETEHVYDRTMPVASLATHAVARGNLDNEMMDRNFYLPSKTPLGSFCREGDLSAFHQQVMEPRLPPTNQTVAKQARLLAQRL